MVTLYWNTLIDCHPVSEKWFEIGTNFVNEEEKRSSKKAAAAGMFAVAAATAAAAVANLIF